MMISALAVIALASGGCAVDAGPGYAVGTGYTGYGAYDGPYYGGYGPYYGDTVIIGGGSGYRHRSYYGGHHLYGGGYGSSYRGGSGRFGSGVRGGGGGGHR